MLYLHDATKWPIQLVLRQYVLQGTDIASAADMPSNQPQPPARTLQMAILVVATVPILIVYPFLQKYFPRGVLIGAIKGCHRSLPFRQSRPSPARKVAALSRSLRLRTGPVITSLQFSRQEHRHGSNR